MAKFADTLTHAGATELARRIEQYWRRPGSSRISCEVRPTGLGDVVDGVL